jgi:Zn-finger nucleic acid-binding protein
MTVFGEGTGTGIAAELAELADRHAGSARPAVARRCVECFEPLVQRRLHDVVIDVCSPHGIWLDRGEIRTAVVNMTAATLDAHARSSEAADPEAIIARGRLNAFLQDLAKEV